MHQKIEHLLVKLEGWRYRLISEHFIITSSTQKKVREKGPSKSTTNSIQSPFSIWISFSSSKRPREATCKISLHPEINLNWTVVV